MPLFFLSIAVKVSIFPVKRRKRRYFYGSTPLTPFFLQFNAVNAAIFPAKRR